MAMQFEMLVDNGPNSARCCRRPRQSHLQDRAEGLAGSRELWLAPTCPLIPRRSDAGVGGRQPDGTVEDEGGVEGNRPIIPPTAKPRYSAAYGRRKNSGSGMNAIAITQRANGVLVKLPR